MLKKLKISIASLMMFGLFAVPVAVNPAVVSAQQANIQDGLCQGSDINVVGAGNPTGNCQNVTDSGTKVNTLLVQIVNIISVIVGVVAVIMIIFGGFKYITSGGDSGNVTGAKNTILYAIIGLVIVALAQFIVRFVLSQTNTLTS